MCGASSATSAGRSGASASRRRAPHQQTRDRADLRGEPRLDRGERGGGPQRERGQRFAAPRAACPRCERRGGRQRSARQTPCGRRRRMAAGADRRCIAWNSACRSAAGRLKARGATPATARASAPRRARRAAPDCRRTARGGVSCMTCCITAACDAPANGRQSGQHLIQHDRGGEQVGAAVHRVRPRTAPATCSSACRPSRPTSVSVDDSTCAMPKSVTFSRPAALTSRFAGLMSRCTTPCSCAKPSAASNCANQSSAVARSSGRPASSKRFEAASVDEFHRDIGGAVGLRRSRTRRRCSDARAARPPAPRCESAPSGSRARRFRTVRGGSSSARRAARYADRTRDRRRPSRPRRASRRCGICRADVMARRVHRGGGHLMPRSS